MSEGSLILTTLLDRLMAGLLNGPAMNCRPHNSRQRIDLASLAEFPGVNPTDVLRAILGGDESAKLVVKVPKATSKPTDDAPAKPRHLDPNQLVTKLRRMTDDARVYQQDTGVHALALGFPLLALPPSTLGKEMTRRVLAPLAFVPVQVNVTRGVSTTISIECYGDGVDRVVPNAALFAWLERLAGKEGLAGIFEDATGKWPLREIVMLVAAAAKTLELPVPAFVPDGHDQMPAEDAPDLALPMDFTLAPAPVGDEGLAEPRILSAAVIGLFPMAKQGLINDMKWLAANGAPEGPIASFLKAGLQLDKPLPASPPPLPDAPPTAHPRPVADVALIADADPCQRGVIRAVQSNTGVVIHGPPGTGKSQTIVNLIGDHLARGQRVLFVCDKRTALDVVLNRMSFAGLGDLCAVVHDPQADQRDLYRAVREQLTSLSDKPAKSKSKSSSQTRIDQELDVLQTRLLKLHQALMLPNKPGGTSFHQLVGEWFSLRPRSSENATWTVPDVALEVLDAQTPNIRTGLDRAIASRYADNAWAGYATSDLAAFLARPVSEVRDAASRVAPMLGETDATIHPAMPVFDLDADLLKQAAARMQLADALARVATIPLEQRAKLNAVDALTRVKSRLAEAKPALAAVEASSLDFALVTLAKSLKLTIPQLAQHSAALQAYIESTKSLFGVFAFGRKSEARAVLSPFGLSLDAGSATRVQSLLDGLRHRLVLTYLQHDLAAQTPPASVADVATDEELKRSLDGYAGLADMLALLDTEKGIASLRSLVLSTISGDAALPSLIAGLRASTTHANAIQRALDAAEASKLFSVSGIRRLKTELCAAMPLADRASRMVADAESLESIVRVEKAIADTAEPLRGSLASAARSGMSADAVLAGIRRKSLDAEIRVRLAADPSLQASDARDLAELESRIVEFEKERQIAVRAGILDFWREKAASRLVANERASALGADTARRFLMTGKNAMRLRSVIALGRTIEGGDPLFDLRPVWMASPETVAQLFGRAPMFDAVIFDEASQLRLEEALPVLMRGKRVVIAGDEKQLPPTRFFESTAVTDSEDVDSIETGQQLFESQQASIEDLLSASLHLQINEAYLDVHYRSRNADLIEFSNRYFYGSRLQALPTPPTMRIVEPPVRLIRVEGVYDTGTNEIEAAKVVDVVKELLSRKNPPSVGIACMNVLQRDLIIDALDAAAEADEAFAKRLDTARSRVGKGAFEGLFVKNLENVQGDERDHIIIATTYGPDAKGRFYERFGPLQTQGGGRRLNVLVTRAREQVHLVTSVPASRYAALPPVPADAIPTGGWLLYAYLKYADDLTQRYNTPATEAGASAPAKRLDDPHALAASIGEELAGRGVPSILHYGNAGFCVDLALVGESNEGRGLLVDTTRFAGTDDPIAWDVFRVGIFAQQGWSLERLWSPHFYRDPEGELKRVLGQPGN